MNVIDLTDEEPGTSVRGVDPDLQIYGHNQRSRDPPLQSRDRPQTHDVSTQTPAVIDLDGSSATNDRPADQGLGNGSRESSPGFEITSWSTREPDPVALAPQDPATGPSMNLWWDWLSSGAHIRSLRQAPQTMRSLSERVHRHLNDFPRRSNSRLPWPTRDAHSNGSQNDSNNSFPESLNNRLPGITQLLNESDSPVRQSVHLHHHHRSHHHHHHHRSGTSPPGHNTSNPARPFPMPSMDFTITAFSLNSSSDTQRRGNLRWQNPHTSVPTNPEPVPSLPALAPPREGFTRSPDSDEVLVCPSCDVELGTGSTEAQRAVWVFGKCGHVYCGACGGPKKRGTRNLRGGRYGRGKGKERVSNGDREKLLGLAKCLVPGCETKNNSGKAMWQVYL